MIRIGAILACCLLTGCVERLFTVRSDPPGAIVRLDDEVVGTTPCEVEYVWYGTREISVELSGYRPVSRLVEFPSPWWQFFPLDFLTDVVLPFTITDRKNLRVSFEPAPATIDEARGVLERAAEMRRRMDFPDKSR